MKRIHAIMIGLKDITQIITEYGISALLIALACYGLVIVARDTYNLVKTHIKHTKSDVEKLRKENEGYIEDKLRDKTNAIDTLNEKNADLSKLLLDMQQNLLEAILSSDNNKTHTNLTLSDQTHNIKIDNILNMLLKKSNADRISLYLFHNGDVSMSGQKFQKMSCVHQVVKVGIATNQTSMQSIFQAMALPLIKELVHNDFCSYKNIKYFKDQFYVLYNVLENIGIGALFCKVLKNVDGLAIGFICAEFVNVYDEEFEPGETKLKELLQEYALRIEGLL